MTHILKASIRGLPPTVPIDLGDERPSPRPNSISPKSARGAHSLDRRAHAAHHRQQAEEFGMRVESMDVGNRVRPQSNLFPVHPPSRPRSLARPCSETARCLAWCLAHGAATATTQTWRTSGLFSLFSYINRVFSTRFRPRSSGSRWTSFISQRRYGAFVLETNCPLPISQIARWDSRLGKRDSQCLGQCCGSYQTCSGFSADALSVRRTHYGILSGSAQIRLRT